MNESLQMLWRRLDDVGHDACRLWLSKGRVRLEGMAVFIADGQVCQLRYRVDADAAFCARRASVDGWLGAKAIKLRVHVEDGCWTLNGGAQPALDGCLDLDLGFTPATNLLPLRRLALAVGETAPAPAAYLAFPALRLELLPQQYRRVAQREYDYAAPSVGYQGILKVSGQGVVIDYPGLFRLESCVGPVGR
ncbi:putative glycolipid-binding domain-containing protein [Pseudomonas mangrovi]|uniref:Uncharacterized protein n=1 Tax=Pseudomonas mangrovi TaxID=2161748 RepID=A0A2T5P9L4_9PSED|nr:putative glycolipid-binding domain-containing protein [Pseudomonas mangrovi]PTU74381.1 hypothetical protein DBO85_09810 [Pseudomonas mangrovi]